MNDHRNPAAVCGNCPMWRELSGSGFGQCHLSPPDNITKMPAASEWCGQHPDFWQDAAATDTPRAWGNGVAEALRRKPVNAHMAACADRIVELIDALEKANTELADLCERHDRLRAHCDGIAEKVRGLDMWRSNGGILSVGVNDVLSIVEDDA